MARLVRWNPVRNMLTMQTMMDRMMDDMTRSFGEREWTTAGNWLAVDITDDGEAYHIVADVPGFTAESLEITLHDNTLTIAGELPELQPSEGTRKLLSERAYGHFRRSITLPEAVDADHTTADFENGVLTLVVPRSEAAKPRQISVNSARMIAHNN